MRKVPARLAAKLYGAADLIADRGLADAKIDDIADAAGVPKATLYYYFSGKEEILAFLLGDLLELIAGEVAVAISGPGTARDRLENAVLAQLRVMLEHPAVCRALVGDLGRATRLPELAVALRTAFDEPIEKLLLEGAEDGSMRPLPDPAAAATAVFGAVTVLGLGFAVEGPGRGRPGDAPTAAAAVCDLLLRGLATP